MVLLNSHLEVADFVDVSQFHPGASEFSCGEYAAATMKYAGQPTKGATGTPGQVQMLADELYSRFIGPNVQSDTAGTTNEMVHSILKFLNLPYQDITEISPTSQQQGDINAIKASLSAGYPIIAVITETSAFDLDLGANPYSWGPAGTHLLIYSGIAYDSNLLVRDSANIIGPLMVNNTVRPGPRRYDIQQIGTQWATMVKLPWLPAFGGGSITPHATSMKMVNGWLDVAVEIDVLNKSWDRQGHTPTFIVLHGTAGGSSAQNIANYFKTSDVDASTHFVIGQDGVIVQCIPTTLAAWGNGVLTAGHASYLPENVNPNLYTISIEHVKPSTDNSDQLTDKQKQASFQLIDTLCSYHNIPRRAGDASGGIIRHADIDPVNRSQCPGPYPFDELWTYLKGATTVNTTAPSLNQQQSATDCWNSTAHLFGGTAPRYNSGIAAAWQQMVYQGKNPGPPLTQEYHSVDWNGASIVVQEFAHCRAEYSAGQTHWYDAHGEVK